MSSFLFLGNKKEKESTNNMSVNSINHHQCHLPPCNPISIIMIIVRHGRKRGTLRSEEKANGNSVDLMVGFSLFTFWIFSFEFWILPIYTKQFAKLLTKLRPELCRWSSTGRGRLRFVGVKLHFDCSIPLNCIVVAIANLDRFHWRFSSFSVTRSHSRNCDSHVNCSSLFLPSSIFARCLQCLS